MNTNKNFIGLQVLTKTLLLDYVLVPLFRLVGSLLIDGQQIGRA